MYPQNPYGGYPAQPIQPYQPVNPWQQRLAQMEQQNAPRYGIIHVNGENGARALRMGANSEALVMDDTAPVVWLCQTDGAGYMTATPFEIKPYQAAPPVDVNDLKMRLERLEGMMDGHEPDAQSAGAKRTAKQHDGE